MPRGLGPVLVVVALVLVAGVAVALLNMSGKTIDIRLVDIITASPTRVALAVATTTVEATSTTQPSITQPIASPTATQITIPTTAPTATLPASAVVVPTNTQGPSPTPVVISVQSPQPSASPSGPSPTATPTLAPGTVVEYTIQQGDTLSGIALQFDTTVEAITARNHIDDASSILYGFTLQIVVGEQTPPTAQPSASPQPGNPGTPVANSTALAPTPTVGVTPSPTR